MKLNQDLLYAMSVKIAEHREKKLNKNFVEQKPSAETVRLSKKYAAIIAKIPLSDQRKIFGTYGEKYNQNYILKSIFTAPAKKPVDKQTIRNEIILYAAKCRRTEEVMAKYKKELD